MKMDEYHHCDPMQLASQESTSAPAGSAAGEGEDTDDFDRHRQQLISGVINNDGWRAELVHYLNDIPKDVTKDMDIVAWWGVCPLLGTVIRAVY
jgi:hypothetical protein